VVVVVVDAVVVVVDVVVDDVVVATSNKQNRQKMFAFRIFIFLFENLANRFYVFFFVIVIVQFHHKCSYLGHNLDPTKVPVEDTQFTIVVEFN
jgi:hypothetical protein